MKATLEIDNKTYSVNSGNYYQTVIAKNQIVLSSSYRKDNYFTKRLLHKDFGKSKKWNNYTVTREGNIYQHYDDKYHSDFIGVKEGDKQCISIVLENMGCLFKTEDNEYLNSLNEKCNEKYIGAKNWLGCYYWETYSDKQLKSLATLCKGLCKKYNIPAICIEFGHYHKDISKFRGIVFKSNYVENSVNFNPLFDIDKFNKMLKRK
jgi:N-acetyl-anhydromuramyl-L-alanine amidase AmpD